MLQCSLELQWIVTVASFSWLKGQSTSNRKLPWIQSRDWRKCNLSEKIPISFVVRRQDGEDQLGRRRQLLLQRDNPLRKAEAHLLGRFCQRLRRMFYLAFLGDWLTTNQINYFHSPSQALWGVGHLELLSFRPSFLSDYRLKCGWKHGSAHIPHFSSSHPAHSIFLISYFIYDSLDNRCSASRLQI